MVVRILICNFCILLFILRVCKVFLFYVNGLNFGRKNYNFDFIKLRNKVFRVYIEGKNFL